MAEEFIIQLRISGPEGMSQLFVVPAGETMIGRQTGNDIKLESQLISRQHARLDCTAEGCHITDLGSANGTLVNGERLEANAPYKLAHGATIEIGPFQLAYEQIPVAAPPPAEKKPAKPKTKPSAEKKPARPPKTEPKAAPPAPPPPPSQISQMRPRPDYSRPPVGLTYHSSRLIQYLPGIYHTDFMARFLGIFEAILTPIEWNVDNFDLYLSPGTAPNAFVPWLANWFEITFDSTWSQEQRRTLLAEAHQIYARRGTRWALSRVLEIYTGVAPEIVDTADDLDPFTFVVKIGLSEQDVDRSLIENMIDASKPAHTNYTVEFK